RTFGDAKDAPLESTGPGRKAWDGVPCRQEGGPMSLNLVSLLKEGAKSHPERFAVVVGDKLLSYGLVFDHVKRLAGGLAKLGIHRGQSIALLLPNVPHFTIAYFAAHHHGCPVIPLNVLLTAEEIKYYLEDSEAAAIVTWEAFLPQTLEAARR